MDLFTYLMAKNDHNTSVKKDLFSYLLGKNQSGTYTDYSGTSLSINNTKKSKMAITLKGNTSQTGTPTPSTPIPVNVVSGDNEVVVTGKNVYDDSSLYAVVNCSVSNGVVTQTTADTNSTIQFKVQRYNGSTYYDQVGAVTITGTGRYEIAFIYNSSVMDRLRFGLNGSARDTTCQTGKLSNLENGKTYYLSVNFTNLTQGSISWDNIMISPNSNETYEQYQSQTYEVDLPVENLFSWNSSEITLVKSSNRTISITPLNTPLKLQAGTYTISFEDLVLKNNSYPFNVQLVGLENVGGQLTNKSRTITISEEKTLSYLYIFINGSDNDNATATFSKIQLEKGSTANSYTPYGTTPIEMCKIGTYQDYITKNSDGQWCKYNAIEKRILNGTEAWSLWNIGNVNTQRFYTDFNTSGASDNANTNLCDRFFFQAGSNDVEHFRISNSTGYTYNEFVIFINRDRLNEVSVDGLKTWLASNNLSVYRALTTPYLSLIEDNNLIEQLDNLEKAQSYNGQTNINQTNNDLPFELDVSVKVKV